MHAPFLLTGPAFCLEDRLTEPGEYGLLCQSGKIEALLSPSEWSVGDSIEKIRFDSHTVLLPGMIDLHIHGTHGFDAMDGTIEAIDAIGCALLAEGVTGFLATTMTESPEKLVQVLVVLAQASTPNLLGIHLEGPFLSGSRMGAQCEQHLLPPSIDQFNAFYEAASGRIQLMTLAVEQPGALELLEYAVKKGVIVSIGHTNATFEQTKKAIDLGAHYATHLFNAMRPIHHREPGCVCAILGDRRVTAELILDGVHLHPEMAKFAVQVKGNDRIVLVTDAMRAQCLGDGEFDLGGQQVSVQGPEARLENGTLAGSVLTLKEAFWNAMDVLGLDWVQASQLVSQNPAKVLKCFDLRGSVSTGKRADFWITDHSRNIQATFLEGQRANKS